jgi:beta-galactosidase
MPIVPAALRKRIEDWVCAGGHLLLGPLTGYRTTEWTAHRERELGGLESLVGADVATQFSAMWIEKQVSVEFGDAEPAHPMGFCDGFAPTAGIPLAIYRGGYGDGSAAVVENRMGKGSVVTLGCRVSADVYQRLVDRLLARAEVRPLAAGGDGRVVVAPRGQAGLGVVNLSEQPRSLVLPRPGRDRLTARPIASDITLQPLEVLLLDYDTS